MSVRRGLTAAERDKSVTTSPPATAVTARQATSTTPFAKSAPVRMESVGCDASGEPTAGWKLWVAARSSHSWNLPSVKHNYTNYSLTFFWAMGFFLRSKWDFLGNIVCLFISMYSLWHHTNLESWEESWLAFLSELWNVFLSRWSEVGSFSAEHLISSDGTLVCCEKHWTRREFEQD